jgi:hypothetical protein
MKDEFYPRSCRENREFLTTHAHSSAGDVMTAGSVGFEFVYAALIATGELVDSDKPRAQVE